MGVGIAFQFITNKIPVVLNDLNENTLVLAKEKIKFYLTIFQEEGIIFQDSEEEIMSLMKLTTDMQEISNCDLVIETASENLAVKQAIFKELDEICVKETILTSNTSSFKLSDITRDVTKHNENILLTHFFNPANIVPLVELLRGSDTTDQVYRKVELLFKKINKITIEVKKEVSGLVANRIQTAIAREALSLLEDDVISEDDLEKVMIAGLGFRYTTSGILKIMDFGGLDIWHTVLTQLQTEIESEIRVFPTLINKVEKGEFGVKTTRGFFDYPDKGLDDYVVERDRQLIQQLQTFFAINGGEENA